MVIGSAFRFSALPFGYECSSRNREFAITESKDYRQSFLVFPQIPAPIRNCAYLKLFFSEQIKLHDPCTLLRNYRTAAEAYFLGRLYRTFARHIFRRIPARVHLNCKSGKRFMCVITSFNGIRRLAS